MICPNCQTPLPDDARFCCSCGGFVTAFEPPDGFEIDAESLRFYRDDGMSEDGTERYYTWFDPDSGEYEQGGYPVEQPQREPAREAVTEPEFVFASEDEPQPGIPDGFTLDPSSGLYYLATPGTDSVTGAAGEWYSWYYPDSGEYEQAFYPSDPAPGGGQSPDVQPRRDADEQPLRNTPPKRKVAPLLIALSLIALLAGGAFAFVRLGGLDMLAGSTPSELPEEIVTETLPEEDPPDRDEEAGDSESEGEGDGNGDGNWAALYADYLEEMNLEPRVFRMGMPGGTRGEGSIPTCSLDGETVAFFDVAFYKVAGFDDPLMSFTTLMPVEGGPVDLEQRESVVCHIRDGAVAREFTDEEFDLAFNWVENVSMNIIDGDIIGYYQLVVYESGEAGQRAVRENLDNVWAGLADPESMPVPTPRAAASEEAEEPVEASGDNWAAIYTDFLEGQSFNYQEFTHFDSPGTFPVHNPAGTPLAVMEAVFYDVEGFDYPVMVFMEFAEFEGRPGVLDTFIWEVPYLIRDGEVTWELTEEEDSMVSGYFEESGMYYIKGDFITSYALASAATGENGRGGVDQNFDRLYDWLAYEAQRS